MSGAGKPSLRRTLGRWIRHPRAMFRALNPMTGLRAGVLLTFVLTLASLSVSAYQNYLIRANTDRLHQVQQEAERLSRLTKDLLITQNLQQTYAQWKAARQGFLRLAEGVLVSPDITASLQGPEGRQQAQWTRNFLDVLRPRLQGIEQGIDRILSRSSEFIPGLYLAQDLYPLVDMRASINDITDFSLYVADLLSLRVDGLSRTVISVNATTNAVSAVLAYSLTLLSFVIIWLVINSLVQTQRAIQKANTSLQGLLGAIFDLSGQGFLVFDRSLACDDFFSPQSAKLLGSNPAGKSVILVLPFDTAAQNDFPDAMQIVFDRKVEPDVVFNLFVKEMEIQGARIRLNWRLLPNEQVLVVLTDITREHRLRELMAEDEARKGIVLKAVGNMKYFAEFHQASHQLLERARNSEADPEVLQQLLREVHTFKGNASFFGFDKTAALAHDLEYRIEDSMVLGSEIALADEIALLEDRFLNELGVLVDYLGPEWFESLDAIRIPRDQYTQIERYIRSNYPSDRIIINRLNYFRSVPLKSLFARFPAMASGLASRSGKLLAPVEVRGGHCLVLPERVEGVVQSLVHVVRNMVDHGIEAPYDREAAGKPREGRITISLDNDDEHLWLTFSDDGAGVNTQKLWARARLKDIVAPDEEFDEEKALALVFADGLSTADSAGMTSGRGVGMASVKAEVEQRGGTISISHVPGQGTTIKIQLPRRKSPQ